MFGVTDDPFTRESARDRRTTIVKTTSDGRRHWSPAELNLARGRTDVAWEYGIRNCAGAFYRTSGRIAYDPEQRKWRQVARDDTSSFPVSVPIVLFDKIKVVGCVLITENTSHVMALTGAAGVHARTDRGSAEVFPQEVVKTDCKGTLARYKLSDLSNANHAHYRATDEASSVNVNMPGGIYELAVNLRSVAAWYRSKNPHCRMLVQISRAEENNNSITVDSVISAVSNEITFKERATKSEVMPLLVKSDFKTHKYIACYTDGQDLAGKEPRSFVDVMNAVDCPCHRCRKHRESLYDDDDDDGGDSDGDDYCQGAGKRRRIRRPFRRVFRRENRIRNTYRYRCLEPLYAKTEIQVHNRCFNCSAVTGNRLLPVICRMGAKLLQDTKTAHIDLALASARTQLELQSNGLLPAAAVTLCEFMCWQAKTRSMNREDQMRFYRTTIEPVLKQIHLSRQNYAQSGGTFCQSFIRGHKLIVRDDRSLVSHKYHNSDTLDIFRTHKRKGSPEKKLTSKYPRRSRGPVYMATYGMTNFTERMRLHDMDFPTDEEL